MSEDPCRVESLSVLSAFRTDFFDALWTRRDVLFELTDALLCTDGPMKSLVDLVLAPEHRRGHGGMYDGLNSGHIEVDRLVAALEAGCRSPRSSAQMTEVLCTAGVNVSSGFPSGVASLAARRP